MPVRTAPLREVHADQGDAALVRLWHALVDLLGGLVISHWFVEDLAETTDLPGG